MTDFWETISKRRSVRFFDAGTDVTEEQVDKMIEAARQAPSAGGIYPVDFKVIREKKQKEELMAVAKNQQFLVEAPVVIAIVGNKNEVLPRFGERGRDLYLIQDAAAATQNLLLAATALGLGSCWVGAFEEEEVKEILKLKEEERPLALIPIGKEREE